MVTLSWKPVTVIKDACCYFDILSYKQSDFVQSLRTRKEQKFVSPHLAAPNGNHAEAVSLFGP